MRCVGVERAFGFEDAVDELDKTLRVARHKARSDCVPAHWRDAVGVHGIVPGVPHHRVP